METITLPVFNTDGKEIDNIELDKSVFDGTINTPAIYQAVNGYRANQRKGLASTKTRGEVSGGGKKPWKQKGTGRARVGSSRSPLWRHGGVVFGPHNREYSYKLPKKIKNLALKSTLNSKVKENNLIVLDTLELTVGKTKEIVRVLSNLKMDIKKLKSNNILLLVNKINNTLKLAARNVDYINVDLAKQAHAYGVLSSRKLIITKEGLAELTDKIKEG